MQNLGLLPGLAQSPSPNFVGYPQDMLLHVCLPRSNALTYSSKTTGQSPDIVPCFHGWCCDFCRWLLLGEDTMAGMVGAGTASTLSFPTGLWGMFWTLIQSSSFPSKGAFGAFWTLLCTTLDICVSVVSILFLCGPYFVLSSQIVALCLCFWMRIHVWGEETFIDWDWPSCFVAVPWGIASGCQGRPDKREFDYEYNQIRRLG